MEPLRSEDPRSLGPYRLLSRIGAGGMGVVFLAAPSEGGSTEPAAVKAIRSEYAEDAEFRSRFAAEVDLARRVRGPYTARVLDADTQGTRPWLATEYVPGPSLHEAVRRNGPFPEDSLRVLAAGLAEALAAIHSVGLVHRDLKPSNVLLAPRGPQVIDFGIARAVDATVFTRTGQTLGTPAFMSPEQATGRTVDPRSDLFPFGGVLLFAATGRQPFGGGDPAALLYRVVNEEPDLSGVPESLMDLVAACLAKDPSDRPTPREMADALSGAALPLDDSDPTEWLPPVVATRVIETVASATRMLPTPSPAPPPATRPLAPEPDRTPETEILPNERATPSPAEAGTEEPADAPAEPSKEHVLETPGKGATGSPSAKPAPAMSEALRWEPDPPRGTAPSSPASSGATLGVTISVVALVLGVVFVVDQGDFSGWSIGGSAPEAISEERSPTPSASPTPTEEAGGVEYTPRILDTAFLGDSDRFAALTEEGLYVYETGSSEAIEYLPGPDYPFSMYESSALAVTPDGTVSAAFAALPSHQDESLVHIWDLETSEGRSLVLPQRIGLDRPLALSPDGETVYVEEHTGSENEANEVVAYRSETGDELYRSPLPADGRGRHRSVRNLGVSQDGSLLFATIGNGLAVWDAATGEPRFDLYEAPNSFGFNDSMAVGDDVVVTVKSDAALVWEPGSETDPEELSVRQGSIASGAYLRMITLGDGGNRIFGAGHASDGQVSFLTVWDRDGEVVAQGGTGREYHALSASPDDERLLGASLSLGQRAPELLVLMDEELKTVREYEVPTG
ncbi:WD40 repeat domain-containing serine/threonine protein kinase [Nocardiopsis alba]|uniref:WD40 repeat domain-containing serine/threonine protein kinase n=1 Tax=Nocardiopsis alba TaxID=53437 RepID=UPI00339E040A